jgi:hypothetical protein
MLERLDNDDLPNKCVVLTADDAYQSMVKNAYPLLNRNCCGFDPMVVGFTSTYAVSAFHY